ncbi:dnaJ homolog subfamily B member 12 isoform X2 [Calliphora vicina]|uniref:dnaJ homolog subfamily B member 12 isoform X2 n=1 Tax=Calliphora vicina TaxID=7373 RepID=UPI00325A61E2
MATAYKGMHAEENDTSSTNTNHNNSNRKLNNYDDDDEKEQQIIDIALIEMNNGNYDKAISLLDKAKQLYSSSRAEELQELIIKLQSNAFKSSEPKTTNNSKPTSVHQRKQSNPDARNSADEYKSQSDFTNDQLNLVKKINNCKNYYQVLSVTREASDSEIKKAYKKLALHLHPDKNHAPGAVEAFKTLGNAMTILTDGKKRKEYDLSGGDYITPTGKSSNFSKSTSSFQQYYSHSHQHHRNSPSEGAFSAGEEFTAEELFHMFFGNYPSSQGQYRRRPYQAANQRQPQEQGQQPSLAFVLLLLMILISMFMSLASTDPLYSLSHSSKYNVRRQTQHLSIPYYVKDNFDSDYHGSLPRLEHSVEEDYVYTMKQHCFRERTYREAMMTRARGFGSRAQFAQAQDLKMPSCDNLSKIGITRYSLY